MMINSLKMSVNDYINTDKFYKKLDRLRGDMVRSYSGATFPVWIVEDVVWDALGDVIVRGIQGGAVNDSQGGEEPVYDFVSELHFWNYISLRCEWRIRDQMRRHHVETDSIREYKYLLKRGVVGPEEVNEKADRIGRAVALYELAKLELTELEFGILVARLVHGTSYINIANKFDVDPGGEYQARVARVRREVLRLVRELRNRWKRARSDDPRDHPP